MRIRVGFEFTYEFVAPTPMVLMLNVHPSRATDLIKPDQLRTTPTLPMTRYADAFGNICTRLTAPKGRLDLSTDAVVADSGVPDVVEPAARQYEVAELPHETLVFLLGSRYCETERLMNEAWSRFGDFAHLAVTLCRCMNIPARYCTGYLGDIGVPPEPDPMDFSAWFEVFLGGRWYTFDARHNTPRIGRIVMARGRDAADVAISTTFGPNTLKRFFVRTDEVVDEPAQLELRNRKVA
jgi:transglutaminase-like putative cysteine protease